MFFNLCISCAILRSRVLFLYQYSTKSYQCHPSQQKLVDIVAYGVGSLHEMEADLDRLNIALDPNLVTNVINSSSGNRGNSRRLLRFFSWCQQKTDLGDDLFNCVIRSLSKMKDVVGMGIAISHLQKEGKKMEPQTFVQVADTLVQMGRPEEAVQLFRNVEERHQIQWGDDGGEGWSSVTAVVHALCSKGHARKAQGVLWHHKDKVKEESKVCLHQSLILHGWSVHGNAREARCVIEEMKKSGKPLSLVSYNDLLFCICKRNLKFNPSALVPEATNLMAEMRSSGVSPTTVSFNILLSCLGKTRRVKEACRILFSMMNGEEGKGATPDSTSYYLVIRLLYLTERFGRGNKLLGHMIDDEEKGKLVPRANMRFYHGLIGVLCGIEKMEHALQLFERMKRRFLCCQGNGEEKFDNDNNGLGPTYDLLITKLCRNGKFDLGRNLWDEAVGGNINLQCSDNLLDPLNAPQVFDPTVKPLNIEVNAGKYNMKKVPLNEGKKGATKILSTKHLIKGKKRR